MIIVDTSVWVDYFNGRPTPETDFLDGALGSFSVGIGDLILVEILQGFQSDTDFQSARRLLLKLPVLEMLGAARAVRSAQTYRTLRKRGITVRGTADAIIAAYCVDGNHALLYSDRDFDAFVDHQGLLSAL